MTQSVAGRPGAIGDASLMDADALAMPAPLGDQFDMVFKGYWGRSRRGPQPADAI